MMNEELLKKTPQTKAINRSEQDKPYFSIEDESRITFTAEAEYADVLCEVKDENGNVCLQGVVEGVNKGKFVLEFISKLIPLDVGGFTELVKQEQIKLAIVEHFKKLQNRNLKKGDSLKIQVGNDFYNIEIMHDLNVNEEKKFMRQGNLQYNVSCEISSLMQFRENFNEVIMNLNPNDFQFNIGNFWSKIGDQAIEKFFKTPWAQKNLTDVEIKSIFDLLIKESVVHCLGSVLLDNKDISPLRLFFKPLRHEAQVKNLLSYSRLNIDSWCYFGNMLKKKFDIPKDIEISLIKDIQDEALSGMRHQFVDAESTLEVLDFQKDIPQKDRELFLDRIKEKFDKFSLEAVFGGNFFNHQITTKKYPVLAFKEEEVPRKHSAHAVVVEFRRDFRELFLPIDGAKTHTEFANSFQLLIFSLMLQEYRKIKKLPLSKEASDLMRDVALTFNDIQVASLVGNFSIIDLELKPHLDEKLQTLEAIHKQEEKANSRQQEEDKELLCWFKKEYTPKEENDKKVKEYGNDAYKSKVKPFERFKSLSTVTSKK